MAASSLARCWCCGGGNMAKRPGWQTGSRRDMLTTWRERARDVRGRPIDCGHFLAEEAPDETVKELLVFLTEE